MTPRQADEEIAATYREFFERYGPVPVPGSPGSRFPESARLKFLWSVVEER